MRASSTPTFTCFAPNPAAHLTPSQSEVLHVIRNARGFFRSSGLTLADLGLRLNSLSLREIHDALTSLSVIDLVRPGLVSGAWRAK